MAEVRRCAHCAESFSILDEDLDFYRRMEVPPPTRCFTCRMQRRLAFRNERNLYHRKCDLTGKQIISCYAPGRPNTIYDIDAWWSDDWDAAVLGADYIPSRSFFEQLHEIIRRAPRLSLQQQRPIENSAYCNCASRNKNCYLVFATNRCEDCYYGSWVNDSRDCLDNTNIEQCELCYECVNCRECYNVRYCRDCFACADSLFLRDCNSCRHCFGCTSLQRAEYCIYNKPVGREEYERFLGGIDLGSSSAIGLAAARLESALGVHVVRVAHQTNAEDCAGEYIRNCRNAYYCFETDKCEDVRYSFCLYDARSAMDFSYWGGNAELIYECQACGYDITNLRFCNICWSGCHDLAYCDHCFSCSSCFGCVSLKKAKNCVLNKSYVRHDYETLVKRIQAEMTERGEWGEFMPIELSTFAYNESLAHEQVPLSRAEIVKNGWLYEPQVDDKRSSYIGRKVDLPDNIDEVDDSICSAVLHCAQTGRPYKIIASELKYYRRQRIPLPRLAPNTRHENRLLMKNPRFLWTRECASCKAGLQSPYAPARPERVLCDECYYRELGVA